ncbi:MAG: thiol:disulfide interchange protein DsbA/DsbL [Rubrivivax sp.]|nr:thiol:disulfide interchange protein DsbA/DsbL [Rubrivivax sp.]
MKRREFSKLSLQLAAAGGLAAAVGRVHAQGAPVEGRDYVRLGTPAPVSLPSPEKKVEVVEFFWYGCPHCYAFEPLLESWAKRLPPDVAFRQVPVGFMAPHQTHQKLYYALEDIGALPTLHRRVFNALHQERRRLGSEKEITEFVAANGVDAAKFGAAFKSFSVATKANRAKQLTDAYKIDGVPAMGIHGRFYTSASLSGSHERALAVADFLIQRARG